MNIRARIFGDALSQSPLVTVKKPSGAKANMLNSIRVPREESRRGDMRLADRYRIVGEQVALTRRGARHEAELINIGGGGAMIATAFESRPWERVDLRLGGDCRIACRVLWIRDGRIGLEFTPAIRLDLDDDPNSPRVRELVGRHFPGAHFETRRERGAEDGSDEQREEYRNTLIRLGTVHYDYQSTPARLRDISTAGVMIETSAELSPGAEPLIDLGEAGSVFGTVVWASEGKAGLRFNEPFDWTLLLGPRSEAEQHRWEPPAHLRTEARGDSRWEQHWQKMTLNELNGELDGGLKH